MYTKLCYATTFVRTVYMTEEEFIDFLVSSPNLRVNPKLDNFQTV